MATVICSADMTDAGAAAEGAIGPGAVTMAEDDEGRGAVVAAVVGEDVETAGEGWEVDIEPETADTRLIGARLLPWIDRKLYEWEMEGRGLNDDARRRGAVVPRARETGTLEGKELWLLCEFLGSPGSLKEAEQLGLLLLNSPKCLTAYIYIISSLLKIETDL